MDGERHSGSRLHDYGHDLMESASKANTKQWLAEVISGEWGKRKMEELRLRTLSEIEPVAPPSLWRVTDDSIITHMGGYEYIIRLEHTDTREKVLDWVEHLASKNWMTTEGLKQFARLLMQSRK